MLDPISIRDGDRHHTARLGIRDVGVICTASIVYEIYQRPTGRPTLWKRSSTGSALR